MVFPSSLNKGYELVIFVCVCLQGTEFMDNLAQCLRYYVADRLSNDPGWRNVVVRDASMLQTLPEVSFYT